MGNRLSRIVTRTGDTGTTGLGDGSRVSKNSPRIQVIGEIDELNSFLGLLLTHDLPAALRETLVDVQHDLFDLGGELAMPGIEIEKKYSVERLDQTVAELNPTLPPLKEFILPGGNAPAAVCHVARCICRRAERAAVALAASESINPGIQIYLNRLSDLLFVIARVLARVDGGNEVYWDHGRRGGT